MFSIIIINWNSYTETMNCIASILANRELITRIIIVDNNSSDDSLKRLKQEFIYNDLVKIIESKTNTGYCGGNNLGFQYCLNDNSNYLLVLNNDVIITRRTLSLLKKAFEKDEKLVMVSPMVNGELIENSTFLVRINENLNSTLASTQDDSGFVYKYYIPGCAIAFSKNFLKNYGGFNENYFMYVEEIEIAFRARKNGYNVAQLTSFDSSILRKKDDIEKLRKRYIWYYQTRNMLYFLDDIYMRNYWKGVFKKSLYITFSFIRPFTQRNLGNLIAVYKGVGDYLKGVKGKQVV
ncbi:TPA: glycosyltransferase family 2 protein [Escherichia coli]